MQFMDVGSEWTLVESTDRAPITFVPVETVWLAYHEVGRRPRPTLLSIKLPARTRSTFRARSAGEGLWIRAESDSAVRVALTHTER